MKLIWLYFDNIFHNMSLVQAALDTTYFICYEEILQLVSKNSLG